MPRLPFGLITGTLIFTCLGCASNKTPTDSEPVGSLKQSLAGGNILGQSLPPKTLALTFDDGPGDYASDLSSYLLSQGIRATFFVNGARINQMNLPNPNNIKVTQNAISILKQIVSDGHLIGNHTCTHRNLVTDVMANNSGQIFDELNGTDNVIRDYMPNGLNLFRAPYGAWNDQVYSHIKNSAMDKYVGPIYWDVGGYSNNYPNAAADWACWQGNLYAGSNKANGTGYATTQQCGDAYLDEINQVNKGIILMHDPYQWSGGNTVDMVKYLVPILKSRGYTFVRVDEVPTIKELTGINLPVPNPLDASVPDASVFDSSVPDAASVSKGDPSTGNINTIPPPLNPLDEPSNNDPLPEDNTKGCDFAPTSFSVPSIMIVGLLMSLLGLRRRTKSSASLN